MYLKKLATKSRNFNPLGSEGGFTLMELITTLALVAIISGMAVSNLKEAGNPLANATASVEQFLRYGRSKAIATTSVVMIKATSATNLAASTGTSCTGTLTPMPDLTLKLPLTSSLGETTWTVCFDQRGRADQNVSFHLLNSHGRTKTVHIALGGGTKIDDV